MIKISRRTLVGGLAAAPLARPAIIQAQTVSKPVTIGYLSDVGGPYRENGGVGNRIGAELAVADFGGSVLGRPLEVIQADDQNKPDVGSAIARQWIDDRGVTVLADGASSAAALAIQGVSREKKRIYLMTGPIANALIGEQCSPYGFQFSWNAYAFTKGVTDALTRNGGDTWFTLVIDNESGYSLERDMHGFTKAAGGKVVGAVRTPIGLADYSSFLLQAKASGAKVIGLGLAGIDLQNCIKQAAEFGITEGGQRLATPIMSDPDIYAVGQDICKGLVLSAFFFWTLNPATRAYGERFIKLRGKPPTQQHADSYISVMHWLKAVTAVNTLDADVVAAKMREMPLNDMYNENIKIMPNGCVPYKALLCEVKAPSESKEKFDIFKLIGTLPSADANPPANLFGCKLPT